MNWIFDTGIIKKVTKAKVAVYTCGLDIAQTETKGTVLLKKAEELLDFTRGEEKQLESVSGKFDYTVLTHCPDLNTPFPSRSISRRSPTLASMSSLLAPVSETSHSTTSTE